MDGQATPGVQSPERLDPWVFLQSHRFLYCLCLLDGSYDMVWDWGEWQTGRVYLSFQVLKNEDGIFEMNF